MSETGSRMVCAILGRFSGPPLEAAEELGNMTILFDNSFAVQALPAWSAPR